MTQLTLSLNIRKYVLTFRVKRLTHKFPNGLEECVGRLQRRLDVGRQMRLC